jgi:hypothetical protein
MQSPKKLDIKLQLNLGVLVEPLLVFLEFPVEELTELDRQPLVTCAEVVECLPQQKSTEDGTEK